MNWIKTSLKTTICIIISFSVDGALHYTRGEPSFRVSVCFKICCTRAIAVCVVIYIISTIISVLRLRFVSCM